MSPSVTGLTRGSVSPAPFYIGNTSTPRGRDFSLLPVLINRQIWTNPPAASLNAYLLDKAGPNAATALYDRTSFGAGVNFDGTLAAGSPTFPRNVVITVTHGAAVVALSGVITGIDVHGNTTTEAWSVTAGTVSKTFTGKKAFFRVDSVTVIAATDATTDTVKIGTGSVLGLEFKTPLAGVLKEVVNGVIVTTGVFVAASSAAADDKFGTYAPATIPDGVNDYEIYYFVEDPSSLT